MTYRSESRGFMYTAPPKGDEEDVTDDVSEEATTDEETEAGEFDAAPSVTDANWTGTVPADD